MATIELRADERVAPATVRRLTKGGVQLDAEFGDPTRVTHPG